MNNLIFQNELKNVLLEINRLGIDILLLKGIALINTIYSDFHIRPMSDIDLLVEPQDLSKVKDILKKQGYSSTRSTQISFIKKLGYACILIELHRDIFLTAGEYQWRKFSNITDDLWRRRIGIDIEGRQAYILSPEDLLLHQAACLVLGEAWLRLIWLYDIKAIVDFYKERLNWDLLLERAENYNLKIPLNFVLSYSRQPFNANIPAIVMDRLRPTKKQSLKAKIVKRLLKKGYISNLFRFIYLLVLPSILEKIYILWRGIFPSREFLKRRYSISLKKDLLIHYLMRPFVGLVKVVKVIPGIFNLRRR